MTYHPPQHILNNYAEVLVNFALNSGEGIKKDEVVLLQVPECAKPILIPLQKAVLKAGGHYITQYLPDETSRHFYEMAQDHQLEFFPSSLLKGRVDQADHSITIIAEVNKKELEGIDPKKIMKRDKAYKQYKEWREEKENLGKFTWTLALYGTENSAKEAGISLEEYWNQIIKACYLDEQNPINKWKENTIEINRIKNTLNSLDITSVNIKAEGIDLNLGLDKDRMWVGATGRNIPSFEIFISPDWRRTNGYIEFDQPLYRYGNLVKGIKLEFKEGIVTKASADQNEEVIKEMISLENGNKVGEFSLTDKRFSKINKFMAETLFDENFGGDYGNTHIALGSAYKDCSPHDPKTTPKEKWQEMGFNESVVHTDMISTTPRRVTATLKDGSKILIYENGIFLI
jgi:aminopeptidase